MCTNTVELGVAVALCKVVRIGVPVAEAVAVAVAEAEAEAVAVAALSGHNLGVVMPQLTSSLSPQFASYMSAQLISSLSTQFTTSHFGVTLGVLRGSDLFDFLSTFSDFVWGCSQSVQGSSKGVPRPFRGTFPRLFSELFRDLPQYV